MAAGWVIKRNNKENGPFSAQQLKKFASSGKLKPEDLIRKEPGGKFQRANSIKGLFPEESLEENDAGDSADFANVDISRYGELPMEEDDEYADDERGSRKRGSSTGTKTPPRARGKRKKSATKKGKGKSGKKGKVDWEDDPVDELFWGASLVCFSVGVLFFMDPETWELPAFMVTIHEYTGRFGVSVAILLLSMIFFVPAFQKIGRLKEQGQSIPWRMPYMGWILLGYLGSSEDGGDE